MKISIITATRNCADTIADCLTSVAGQSYPDREHIVIDGVSSDGTLAILKAHRAQLAVLISEPDRGIYDALNKGIAQASGDVIGFLHADDLYADPQVLARIAAAFADPAVDAVYGDLVYVRHQAPAEVVRYWRAGRFKPGCLEQGWMPPHPTFYVRRSVYERLGLFDTRFRISADYECILRFLGRGGLRVAYLPQVLVRMRLGGISNESVSSMLRMSREDYAAMRINAIGGMQALLRKNLTKLPQFVRRAPDTV